MLHRYQEKFSLSHFAYLITQVFQPQTQTQIQKYFVGKISVIYRCFVVRYTESITWNKKLRAAKLVNKF